MLSGYDDNVQEMLKAQLARENAVRSKSATTQGKSVYLWTYRNTSCDVISIIATTVPIRNGAMKDIKLHNKEMKRIKSKPKGGMSIDPTALSPLEQGQNVDAELTRRKMSALLKEEKNNFMTRLQTSRIIRTTIENHSATLIQKLFRGHYTRSNLTKIIESYATKKSVRDKIRSYFDSIGGVKLVVKTRQQLQKKIILTNSSHRKEYSQRRFTSARCIQCAFRCYVSRKCFRRRRVEALIQRRHRAATRIQCMARKVAATVRVKKMILNRQAQRKTQAVLKIQCCLRQLFARRKVRIRRTKFHYVCARVIQCWYRYYHSLKVTGKVKTGLLRKKNFRSAVRIQCLVRKAVAKMRVKRIMARRHFLRMFLRVAKMQTIIRGFLSRRRVKRIKKERLISGVQDSSKSSADPPGNGVSASEGDSNGNGNNEGSATDATETVFSLAKKGKTTELFNLFIQDPENNIDSPDSDGNTILAIAAAYGNIDCFRKILQMGGNVNHRNTANDSVLMLAVKNGHTQIARLILNAPEGLMNPPLTLPLSDEDAAILLVTATRSAPKAEDGLALLNALLTVENISINAPHPETGETAFHVACSIGHLEAVKTLFKYKADINTVDKKGWSCIHAACTSSFDVVKVLLGVDPAFSLVIRDSDRVSKLISLDQRGMDCLILACLYGQNETAAFIRDLFAKNVPKRLITDKSISWDKVKDTEMAFKLVELCHAECLTELISYGFDPSASMQLADKDTTTGVTLPMMAAKLGRIDILDILLSKAPDLTVTDSSGQTIFHYAAKCTSHAIMSHLLTHAHANSCKIDEMALAVVDNELNTPIHIAAMNGTDLSIDLLARRGIEAALTKKNKKGLTPLLTACSFLNLTSVLKLVDMGADVQEVDSDGKNSFWHLYHPDPAILQESIQQSAQSGATAGGSSSASSASSSTTSSTNATAMHLRKAFASEYAARKTTITNKKDRERDAMRLSAEISVALALIRAGCPFFSNVETSVEALTAVPFDAKAPLPLTTLVHRKDLESGDIATQELSYTLLKELPKACKPDDLWRLTLSAIRFDDGTCKALLSLIEGGLVEALTTNNKTFGEMIKPSKTSLQPSSPSTAAATANSVSALENWLFNGMSIAGWSIRLGNTAAFQHLVRRGYSPRSIVDDGGNTCLHYAARYGTPNLVDYILADDFVRMEAVNHKGSTPAMEGAKAGNFNTCKRLFKHGASARRALDGKYWGWMLAMARNREKNEKSLQTGRVGDDDERWWSTLVSPYKLPNYITWYQPNEDFRKK